MTLALLAGLPSTPMMNWPLERPSIILSSTAPDAIVSIPLAAREASPERATEARSVPSPTRMRPLVLALRVDGASFSPPMIMLPREIFKSLSNVIASLATLSEVI